MTDPIDNALQVTPRQLQQFLTTADLDTTTGRYPTLMGRTRWPHKPKRWLINNLRGWFYGLILWMFCSMLMPYEGLRWIWKTILRALKRGDWLQRTAERAHHDLIFQTLGHLSASRFGDTQGTFKNFWHTPSDIRQAPHGGWFMDLSAPNTRLEITVKEHFGSEGDLVASITLALDRFDGRPAQLPPGWLDGLGAECRRTLDDKIELTFDSTPQSRAFRARQGLPDKTTAWAEAFGALLEANGLLAMPEARDATPLLLTRAPLHGAPTIDTATPRAAPIEAHPGPYDPGWLRALWAQKRWWLSTISHHLTFAGVSAGLLGLLHLLLGVGFVLTPDPKSPSLGLFFLAMFTAEMLALLYQASKVLPRPSKRRMRSEKLFRSITWDGERLAIGDAWVALDKPFSAHLTRSPSTEPDPSLTVELRQRDRAPGEDGRVRFRVRVGESDALGELQALETRAPRIGAEAFESWVWPLIRTFGTLQGLALPWSVSTQGEAGRPSEVGAARRGEAEAVQPAEVGAARPADAKVAQSADAEAAESAEVEVAVDKSGRST